MTKVPIATFSEISAWYSSWANFGLEKSDREMAILAVVVPLNAGVPPSVALTVRV